MIIAIHGKKIKTESVPLIQQLMAELLKRKAGIMVSRELKKELDSIGLSFPNVEVFTKTADLSDVNYVFSLGGDGTLLETVTYIGPLEKPILGINTGRLGFLATIPKMKVIQAIEAIYQKTYSLDSRALLHLDSNKELFNGLNFALNDFTILKTHSSSMITVHAYLDGEYLNSYWADGIILSTPTGSTGYSLSCGGPIVLPHSNNFVLTPVSAHNLNVRPLIFSDKSVISFEVEGRSDKFLVSLDARSTMVDSDIQLAIRKEHFRAVLMKLDNYNHLDTLRSKLNWGLDLRN
jgi:NAD+ kinase